MAYSKKQKEEKERQGEGRRGRRGKGMREEKRRDGGRGVFLNSISIIYLPPSLHESSTDMCYI